MVLHTIADVLACLLGIGVIVVGLRFLLVPDAAATAYGVSASSTGDAAAYLSIKGLRDGVSGVVALALLATGQQHGLGVFLLAAALIPLGDALIVLRHNGSRVLAYAMHGGTAVVMIAVGAMLLAL